MDYDLKSVWNWALSNLDRFKGLFILLSVFSIHLVSIVTSLGTGLWVFVDASLISQLVFKLALTITLAIAGKEFLIFFAMITLRTFSDSRFAWLNEWMLTGRRIVEANRNIYLDLFVTTSLFIYIYSSTFFSGITARFFYIAIAIVLTNFLSNRFFKTDLLPPRKPSKESSEIETAYKSTGYGLGFLAVFIAWDLGISRAETIIGESIVRVTLSDQSERLISLIEMTENGFIFINENGNAEMISSTTISSIENYVEANFLHEPI